MKKRKSNCFMAIKFMQGMILLLLSSCAIATAPPDKISVRYIDPLKKVLKTDRDLKDDESTIDAARGEVASLQFVITARQAIKGLKVHVKSLNNGDSKLSAEVKYEGYVEVTGFTNKPGMDKITSPDGYYPDPLLEESSMDVPANQNQPVWVSVPVPVDCAPGAYQGNIVFEGKTNEGAFRIEKKFTVNAYKVQLKRPDLMVSMWPMMEMPHLPQIKNIMARLSPQPDKLTAFSDEYWAYLKQMATMMHQYYQNTILLYPVHTVDYKIEGNKYAFDFTQLDHQITIFKEAGIKYLEGSFLGGRDEGWDGPFSFYYYMKNADGGIGCKTAKLDNPDMVNFYKQFIPAWIKHLKEKGWYEDYYQHIADEPTDRNVNSYNEFYRFIKTLAPDIKTIEAVQSVNIPDINIAVPQLDFLNEHYDYFRRQAKNGMQVWMYVCWLPQGEYANRLIEQPLIKTRILHWINYTYDIKGYLHWAYNNWENVNPLEVTGSPNDAMPGGDKWIVYPGKGKFLSSIRLEAMRDGIVDYTLLKMLAAKNPVMSRRLADRIVYGFDNYQTSVSNFRKTRKALLTALSQ